MQRTPLDFLLQVTIESGHYDHQQVRNWEQSSLRLLWRVILGPLPSYTKSLMCFHDPILLV